MLFHLLKQTRLRIPGFIAMGEEQKHKKTHLPSINSSNLPFKETKKSVNHRKDTGKALQPLLLQRKTLETPLNDFLRNKNNTNELPGLELHKSKHLRVDATTKVNKVEHEKKKKKKKTRKKQSNYSLHSNMTHQLQSLPQVLPRNWYT